MKKCPYCAEKIKDAAIVCKHCGRDLVPGASARVAVPKKTPVWAVIIALIVVIGLCAFCVFGIPAQNKEHDAKATIAALTETTTPIPSKEPTETPKPTATKDPNKLDSSEAGSFAYLSQEYVLAALKAPSTAEFPSVFLGLGTDYRFLKKDGVVTVQSWVDAENSFGAKIRSKFTVQFDYTTETMLYLEIDGEVIYGTPHPIN